MTVQGTPVLMLDLAVLMDGTMPSLSTRGAAFAEAARVCLQSCSHSSPVELQVVSADTSTYQLDWMPAGGVSTYATKAWDDPEEATEHGAMGLAICLVHKLTNLVVVGRAKKKGGFDFWLGKKDSALLFQGSVRLEVSGILKNPGAVKQRTKFKQKQMTQSANLNLTGYSAVVEFSTPMAQVQST